MENATGVEMRRNHEDMRSKMGLGVEDLLKDFQTREIYLGT